MSMFWFVFSKRSKNMGWDSEKSCPIRGRTFKCGMPHSFVMDPTFSACWSPGRSMMLALLDLLPEADPVKCQPQFRNLPIVAASVLSKDAK